MTSLVILILSMFLCPTSPQESDRSNPEKKKAKIDEAIRIYLEGNPNESDDDRKRRKLQRYTEATRDLYQFYESRQPFFAELMLGALRELDQVAWREVIQFRHRSPSGEGYDPKYWENAAANAAKVQAAADRVLLAIRARVQLWEKFDPGP